MDTGKQPKLRNVERSKWLPGIEIVDRDGDEVLSCRDIRTHPTNQRKTYYDEKQCSCGCLRATLGMTPVSDWGPILSSFPAPMQPQMLPDLEETSTIVHGHRMPIWHGCISTEKLGRIAPWISQFFLKKLEQSSLDWGHEILNTHTQKMVIRCFLLCS